MARVKLMKPPLRDRVMASEEYTNTTVHLRFHAGPEFPTSQAGWAIFRIDESSGSLAVESDWGNYAYRWGHGGRRERTLREFLSTCSEGYIATKLLYGHREQVFDEETTRKEMKKAAREWFREGRINIVLDEVGNAFELFRSLTSEIHEFCRNAAGVNPGTDLYYFAGDLLKKAFDPLYEHVHTEMPAWHQVLHQEIIPAFQAYLRGEIDEEALQQLPVAPGREAWVLGP